MTQPGGPSSGGGGYDVDITRAPQAIRELENALTELKEVKQAAIALGQVNPPARDQVSLDAAERLSKTGVGEKGSFTQALDEGIAEVSRMIDALRSGFVAYERGDLRASNAFSQQR